MMGEGRRTQIERLTESNLNIKLYLVDGLEKYLTDSIDNRVERIWLWGAAGQSHSLGGRPLPHTAALITTRGEIITCGVVESGEREGQVHSG